MSITKEPSGIEDELTEPATAASPSVMVVEDFDETRFLIRLSLELDGYRVMEAVSGEEAIEVARRERPDLILMDLDLPLVDGFAAIRRIREQAELRHIPVVAVGEDGTADYRHKVFAAGCNEYVTKPIDFDRLENLLGRLLHES